MNMFTKFQVDIINLRTPAAPRTRRRILLSSTVSGIRSKALNKRKLLKSKQIPSVSTFLHLALAFVVSDLLPPPPPGEDVRWIQ